MDARIFDKVDALEPGFNPATRPGPGPRDQLPRQDAGRGRGLERLDPGPLDPKEYEPPPARSRRGRPREKAQDKGAEGTRPRTSGKAQDKPQQASEKREEAVAKRPGRDDGAGPRAVGLIREIIAERVNDPHVKQLLLAFLDDPQIAAGLPLAPAAKGVHHAYRGGLAEHLLSVLRLTLRVADHYPMADRDLLLAGALLHDVMKVAEISPEKGFEYTDEGKLVGHLVMTAQKIREKTLAIPGFPPALEHHITHLVLAHHGQLEYGSPKVPMTLEALIVHSLDSLDSRIASWLEAMARDPNDRWTENAQALRSPALEGPCAHLPGQVARGDAPQVSRGAPQEQGQGRRAPG